MDLVDFDRRVFDTIVDEFDQILAGSRPHPIPIARCTATTSSARSERTPWFSGQSLLEFLRNRWKSIAIRVRSRSDFRCSWCCAQRTSSAAMPARSLGSGAQGRRRHHPADRTYSREAIVTFDGELETAYAGQSVTLTLDDEIDISRGDMITIGPVQRHSASVPTWCGWMNGRSTRRAGLRAQAHHANGDRRSRSCPSS